MSLSATMARLRDPLPGGCIPLCGAILLLTACATWTPGWETDPERAADAEEAVAAGEAERLLETAGDTAGLERAIAAYEGRLAENPADEQALVALADAYILRGAAYRDTRTEKRDDFVAAIRYAERALAGNAAFQERINAGDNIAAAAAVLGEGDVPAMVFWVTGVFYYFDEGLNPLQRAIHFNRLQQARSVLERAGELDPDYSHGLIPFSLGIYYIAVPGFAGRDFERAEALLAEADAAPGDSLLPRWGRARYLHTAQGDREAFRDDLEWVLAQDAQDSASRYRWNVFIQRDARALLDGIDERF